VRSAGPKCEVGPPSPPRSPYKRSTNSLGRQRPSPSMETKPERRQRFQKSADWSGFLEKEQDFVKSRRAWLQAEKRGQKMRSRVESKPELCPETVKILESQQQTRMQFRSTHERLYKMAAELRKRAAAEKKRSIKEDNNFPFKPTIAKETAKILDVNRKEFINTFNRPLVVKKKKRKTSASSLPPPDPDTFTFKPVVNERSAKLVQKAKVVQRDFNQRVLDSVLRYYRRLSEYRNHEPGPGAYELSRRHPPRRAASPAPSGRSMASPR
jgi:hypothetical protein